jgi:hypothetical protein
MSRACTKLGVQTRPEAIALFRASVEHR